MKVYTNSSMNKGYSYKKGTKVQLLEQKNSVAKVKVVKTNNIRYVYIKYLK